MPIVPLYGHSAVAARLLDAHRRGQLPSSLLLHGPAGIGKQRLALEVARTILCAEADAPCARCQSCRFAAELQHPDLHWYFPVERMKDPDPDAAAVRAYYGEKITTRVAASCIYEAPSGSDALYVATMRAIVQAAAMSPAISRRKVFVIGDAERMVAQEGADQAANAFLKLLEEPPADTLLLLTSSEPGALIPTIRSRVVSVRIAPLPDAEVEAFLDDPRLAAYVASRKPKPDRVPSRAELVAAAAGAPGRVVSGGIAGAGAAAARRMLDAATGRNRAPLYREAFARGVAGARGGFADTLEAMTAALHERVRRHVARDEHDAAYRATLAMADVELAKERANGNVSPQLVSAALLRAVRERAG